MVVGDPGALAHGTTKKEAVHEVREQDLIVLARKHRPPLHEAADEQDPRPNGVQIR